MHTKKDILKQISQTITTLNTKKKDMEPIIDEYIVIYTIALSSPTAENLKPLLSRAREYLETSSFWQQDFLTEMAKTEKMIIEYVTN